MTNEEAIKYLHQIEHVLPLGGSRWLDEQRTESIRMAIEALSQSVTKKSDQDNPPISVGLEPAGCVARTQADIDAAMAEVEEKSKVFTAAHQGETAEEILAAMRGEDAAESLGLSQEEYGKLVDECIYGDEPLDVDAIIEESKQAQADEILSQVIEEPASEDLEKAAMAFFPCFKAGANWQKQQMMKNVVLETVVLKDSDGDGIETPYEEWLTLEDTEITHIPGSIGLNEGDKVKVIIVKQD